MSILGFDFGTTNSLISYVRGGEAITIFEDGQPIPSVVSFKGEKVLVGKEARRELSTAGLGVHGNTVRSPKTLLGREEQVLDGVRRDPIKIVEHVLQYVRNHALKEIGSTQAIDRVVATIPVNMNGARRANLRQAFRQAGMSIVQFVHEPLAALYAHIRQSEDPNILQRLNGKLVLVFDWGGGTLDLTLCRILDGQLFQIANHGTEDVGGDHFDDLLCKELEKRSRLERGLGNAVGNTPGAKKKLVLECEQLKIALSDVDHRSVFVDNYYHHDGDASIDVRLTRTELETMVTPLVNQGLASIERLLDQQDSSTASIELCLATGGMVNMPLIRRRLEEMFGPARVCTTKNSATAIAEGAAWVAHDGARLRLAKKVEVALARNTYVTALDAGVQMPSENETSKDTLDLYCVDPSDGQAKFTLLSPHKPGTKVNNNDKRRPLETMTLNVDARAKPFTERLKLTTTVDDDLILTATAWSLSSKVTSEVEIHDLEFALAISEHDASNTSIDMTEHTAESAEFAPGDLTLRPNVSSRIDKSLVPGEVMYKHYRHDFNNRGYQKITQQQIDEHLYYVPCSICRRPPHEPGCRCLSRPSERSGTDTSQIKPKIKNASV